MFSPNLCRAKGLFGASIAFLMALTAIAFTAPPAEAVDENANIGTWNAQGSNVGSNANIWTDAIPRLMDGNFDGGSRLDLLTVQEAGPRPPARAVATGRIARIRTRGGATRASVREYRWRNGTATRGDDLYIYFGQRPGRNSGVNRLNVATVTRTRADTFAIAWRGDVRRPTIGVYFQDINTAFWNVHIRSGGGERTVAEANNYIGYIRPVARSVFRNPDINSVIMGDWNTTPDRIDRNQNGDPVETVAPPCEQPTQRSGRVLDYGVLDNQGENTLTFGAVVDPATSDHDMAQFRFRHTNQTLIDVQGENIEPECPAQVAAEEARRAVEEAQRALEEQREREEREQREREEREQREREEREQREREERERRLERLPLCAFGGFLGLLFCSL